MVKATTPQKPKRRSPITRAEGERRLIDAATQLTKERPYSEVGVRDIAAVADVNHGFVHTWFGSKNDLLLAVVRRQFQVLAENVLAAEPGTPALDFFDPEVVGVVRLVLWLDLEGCDTSNLFSNMPILDALTSRYIEVEKIDPSIARQAAIQAIAIGLGAGTFAPILGMDNRNEAKPVMDLWRHIIGLLAKYPPA
jgi:TetR/AcrR family transcriptional regulator, repressor for neighboring sulfatase